MSRKSVLYANTQFSCARYYPSGVQVLATGTDRRITWWEVYDASLVRDVEASQKGSVNWLALNLTGDHFVSVDDEQLVKLWDYQLGAVVAVGRGHAAVIVTCAYSPCGRMLVTGSADGAVVIWAVPEVWPLFVSGMHMNIATNSPRWFSLQKYWYKTQDEQKIAAEPNRSDNDECGVPLSANSSATQLSGRSNASRGSRGGRRGVYNGGGGSRKPTEMIQQLETSRSNRDPHICECPSVDPAGQTDVNEQCVYVESSEQ